MLFFTLLGTVMGIIVGGFGGGAMVFNQVQTKILNPDNVPVTLRGYLRDIFSSIIIVLEFSFNRSITYVQF